MSEIANATPAQRIPAEKFTKSLADFIATIRRRWPIVAAAIVVFLTLAIIYIAQVNPVYEGTTRLLVLQQGGHPVNVSNSDAGTINEGNSVEDYITTHLLLVSSPIVVQDAIDRVGESNLPSLAIDQKAGETIIDTAINSLKVTRPDRMAKVLRVAYRAHSPGEATLFLEGLAESYKHFLENTFNSN